MKTWTTDMSFYVSKFHIWYEKNSILTNAEEKAEMWIYASSPTIKNGYQTDTIKFSDLTLMTEPLPPVWQSNNSP